MNKAVLALSKLLPLPDRDVVLGDLQESRLSTREACLDLLGLFLRRMLQAYSRWRPWVCLALTPLLSLLLIGVSVSFAEVLTSSPSQQAHTLPSNLELLRLGVLLAVASISATLAASHALGRPAMLLMVAAIVPAIECFSRFHIAGVPRLCVFLFLLPVPFAAWLEPRIRRNLNLLGMACTLLLLGVLAPTTITGYQVISQCLLLISPALYCTVAGHPRRRYV